MRPFRFVLIPFFAVHYGGFCFGHLTVEENLQLGAFTRNNKSAIKKDLDRVYEYFPILKEKRKQVSGLLKVTNQFQQMATNFDLYADKGEILSSSPSTRSIGVASSTTRSSAPPGSRRSISSSVVASAGGRSCPRPQRRC